MFQKLYNWIKHKTLPPSFLFKNRLFVERDSKHKRILTNFGLVFRNSKWSSYSNYNIKLTFKNVFYYLTRAILFLIFLYFFDQHYVYHYLKFSLLNYFLYWFWIGLDVVDYYVAFFIWSFVSIIAIAFNMIYSYFFFNNFSFKTNESPFFKKNFFLNWYKKEKFITTDKQNLNWVLYSWITNKNSFFNESSENHKLVEKMFKTTTNLTWWNKNFDFFPKLYSTNFYFNLFFLKNNNFNFFNQLHLLTADSSNNKNENIFWLFINNISKGWELTKLTFWNFALNIKTCIMNTEPIVRNYRKKSRPNLSHVNKENKNSSPLLDSKSGLFYFFNLNHQNLITLSTQTKEFSHLYTFFASQSKISKWNRWMYKYSILHRKILKNSHKLTLSKKIIHSGFFDNSLVNRNLWNSEHISKFSSQNDLFSSFFNVYYKNSSLSFSKFLNLNSNSNILNNISQNNSLTNLAHYEFSYFWFLKRFYFFNTLPNNLFLRQPFHNKHFFKNFQKTVIMYNNMMNNYFLTFSYLFKIRNFTLNPLTFDNAILIDKIYKNCLNNITKKNNNHDLYSLTENLDLLTKDNLNILINLTNNENFIFHTNKIYFNYLNFEENNFINSLIFPKKSNLKSLNYYLLLSLLNNKSTTGAKDFQHFTFF